MKPRPSALTSPAPCGAFLCLSASPLNRAAQAPPLPRCRRFTVRPSLSPFRPAAARLVQGKPRPRRPLPDQSKPRRLPLVPPFDRAALALPHAVRPPPLERQRQPPPRRRRPNPHP